MRALLISTFDLGRQPFGLASPAAWLREAGVQVTCADLAKERLDAEAVRAADAVAFFLPMHTATRLALPVVDRVREWNPTARLIAYGLYGPLNESLLRDRGVTTVLGGEFEEALVSAITGATPSATPAAGAADSSSSIPHLHFRVPDRHGLPPLTSYARLQVAGESRTVGYTEASRGCRHLCRHCPIVPIYNGRFRVVPPDVVLADVAAQVAAGARHITFGDPDFFNGIRHAQRVVEGLARRCPGVSYDVTIKVEHLLRHADMLRLLRETGCAFVTSAVESIDDEVLRRLEKGHTRADFERVVDLCAAHGLPLAPTFVPFTPWTTLDGYIELLRALAALRLQEHVAPIQLVIRLLIPEGSRLLELDDIRAVTRGFDSATLTHRWAHPDPRVDRLQERLAALVGLETAASRIDTFRRVWQAAHEAAGVQAPPPDSSPAIVRATIPYLNEPWYC